MDNIDKIQYDNYNSVKQEKIYPRKLVLSSMVAEIITLILMLSVNICYYREVTSIATISYDLNIQFLSSTTTNEKNIQIQLIYLLF